MVFGGKKVENSHFMDKSIKCLKTHFLVKNLKIKESKVKIFEDSKFVVKIKKKYIIVPFKWY